MIPSKMTMDFAMNNQSTPAVGCPINTNILITHHVEEEADRTLNDVEESFIQDFIQSTDAEEQPFQILESNAEELDIKTASYVQCTYGNLEDERDVVLEEKCVASINQLKALLGTRCHQSDCIAELATITHKTIGFCVKLEWMCKNGHRDIWYSSRFYASGLAINYIVQTAILLSGGQISQFRRFCNFAKIGNCCISAFNLNQRLYASTAVDQEYNEQRNSIIAQLKTSQAKLTLCGDGRMDSPGYSATKGTYTLMDYASKKLLTMECGGKREASSKYRLFPLKTCLEDRFENLHEKKILP